MDVIVRLIKPKKRTTYMKLGIYVHTGIGSVFSYETLVTMRTQGNIGSAGVSQFKSIILEINNNWRKQI